MDDVLKRVRAGTLSIRDAAKRLRLDALRRLDAEIQLDVGRALRTGVPEIVIAEGKTPAQTRAAATGLLKAQGRAIITRVDAQLTWGRHPGVDVVRHPEARIIVLRRRNRKPEPTGGRVAVLAAGTSDRAVASEAAVVVEELGCAVRSELDVGVAGLHRLLLALERLVPWEPHAFVVTAGREGALAPVVAGLVDAPVIGLPVSTGYGHRGKGEAALATMLQSCAPLAVVNIDAGVIAGAVAAQFAAKAGAAERRGGARKGRMG